MKHGTNKLIDMLLSGHGLEEARAKVAAAFEAAGADPMEEMGGTAAPATTQGTSGIPRDLAKLKSFVSEGEWNLMRHGRSKKYRIDRDGNPAKPGYCQGSKTGSCGDDLPSLDTPYVYRKQDQPGGAATVCLGCFDAAGGVPKPYEPQGDTAPVVPANEELPF